MYNKFSVFLLTASVFLGSLYHEVWAEEAKVDTEIAVLIDVSGSMKQNDPQNLRVPALKLLLSVLPESVRASLWLFAENTTPLMPLAPVDAAWKEQALQSLHRINSKGLFTNIEAALLAATQAWNTKQPNITRNVLLLTDGMIDVAKDKNLSVASKTRVLQDLLPQLQQAGVHVQTIALSANADTALLKKLATATQGWHESVASAEQLERIFFKMFKQAVPHQESVPIQGNKFSVDASIKEFSVLVFKKSDALTELVAPDKQHINRGTQTKSVRWSAEQHYDLATIKDPQPGEWQIIADMDPDNQVMIVTDLKFALDPLPKYKMELQALKFRAHFSDKGELLQREDFLKLVKVVVKNSDGVNEYPELALTEDPTAKGYFVAAMDEPLPKGSYYLKIVADGKTFTREISHTLEILATPIAVSTTVHAEQQQVDIILKPDSKLLDPASLVLEARLNQLGQEPKVLPVNQVGEQWQITLHAPANEDAIIVNFVAKAKTLNGEDIEPELQPVVVDAQLFAPEPTPPVAAHEEHAEEHVAPSEQHDTPVEATEPVPAEEPPNWSFSIVVVVLLNVILGVAGFFIFRYVKKQAATKQAQILSRLS